MGLCSTQSSGGSEEEEIVFTSSFTNLFPLSICMSIWTLASHAVFVVSAPECRDIETVLYNRTSIYTYVRL